MYVCCGATALTHYIDDRFTRNIIRAILFIPIYVIQMIFQAYMKNNFPSSGYMIAFQWISLLSILFAFPLGILIAIEGEYASEKLLYIFIYPFVFQIYLHIGYVCFYLYCDEGYLSSALLLSGSFALGNVLHSAFYLIFPRTKWEAVPDKDNNYNSSPIDTAYAYRAKALYDCMYAQKKYLYFLWSKEVKQSIYIFCTA
jgi:hypothetical protein